MSATSAHGIPCDIPQRRIAAAVGIAQPAVSRYLNGDRWPSAERLQQLADAMGMTPDDLARHILGNRKKRRGEV